jgi:UDP-2-acetamido-3-amino-2,3-dideoxy-glucuronate N-acetyltransferase
MSLGKKPRVGVAGAGTWGKNLVRNCAEAGVLAAVCDKNPLALAAFEADYPGIAVTPDFGHLLDLPIDAVVIASPAPQHASMAIEAIESGKHVFVEKPFALDPQDATKIVTLAESRGLQTFAGHLLLYHPAVEIIRHRLAAGSIGELRHIRSRRLGFGRLRDHENAWWSFAPHDVAVMLALTHKAPIDCMSRAVCVTDSELSDFCYADYSFDTGVTAHVEVGWLDPVRSHRLDVIGTRGTLTFTDTHGESHLTQSMRDIGINEYGAREARATGNCVVPLQTREPLRAEIEAFVAAIQNDRPAITDGRSAIAVTVALAMASACALSEHAIHTGV